MARLAVGVEGLGATPGMELFFAELGTIHIFQEMAGGDAIV